MVSAITSDGWGWGYSPAGGAEWNRTNGGVQRPPVPKLHLSAAHLHRWGERYATSAAIRALRNIKWYQDRNACVSLCSNFLLIVWNFSGYASTASLTACKSLRWKSGSWAAQVPEALSHHIKASGHQKVIFDPQDPWVLVALKAFGTLEDRQKTLKWYKNLSMSYLNLTIEGDKEAVLSNIGKWRQKGRLDRSWEPPTHPFNCPMRKALIFNVEGKNRSSITTIEATSGRAAGRSLQCFQFISRQRRHAGSDGWSSNTPVTRDWNRLWALKWEWIGGGNTTWPTGCPWKTFKFALQIP